MKLPELLVGCQSHMLRLEEIWLIYQVSNSKGGLSGSLEQEGVIRELGVGGLEGCQDSGHSNGGSALDVVIEGAVLVAVLFKEPDDVRKILMPLTF